MAFLTGPRLALDLHMHFWKKRDAVPELARGTLRHQFVIGPIRPAGLNLNQGRLYYCTACRWKFLVCGTKVLVLAEDETALAGAEAVARYGTFAEGPCPVLEEFASAVSGNFNGFPMLVAAKSARPRNPAHSRAAVRLAPVISRGRRLRAIKF